MAINTKKYIHKKFGYIILLFVCLMGVIVIGITLNAHHKDQYDNEYVYSYILHQMLFQKEEISSPVHSSIQSSEYTDMLVDKVYTFLEGHYILNISDLYLIKGFRYSIRLAIVTDNHQCNMEINLTDPIGWSYYIFATDGNKLTFNEYREIPYGAARTGNHTLYFEKLDGPNLNIHIQVINEGLCYELFDPGENIYWIDLIPISRPEPPSAGINYQKYLYLLPQRMYSIHISRVSAVRADYSNKIYVDHNVVDPSEDHISFPIYTHKLMNGLFEEDQYHFGTAIQGTYLFNFTFYPDMEYTNILLFVVDEGQIATGQKPLPFNISYLLSLDLEAPEIVPSVSMPFEAQLGLGIGIGSLIIIGLSIAFYTKHKSNL